MTVSEVEARWIRDRIALLDCGQRKAAMQKFFVNRDKELR